MQARGYRFVRSALVRDQSWSFWWSDGQRQCVSVSTMDGRYASIQRVPERTCQGGGASNDAPPADAPPQRRQPYSPESHPERLTLVCYGEGSRLTYTPHAGYEWNHRSHRYEPTTGFESGNEQFNSAVQVEIREGMGRIHLTGKLIPPLHAEGDHGWWNLSELRVTRSHITARYRLNLLSRPSIDIDRHSGLIEIKGTPGFSGRCDIGDWGAGRRF
ncbi:hypothetical protein SAMN05216359_101199 [Roseateles sp. YR242]|nr:hypothetical protein SAMN05216359_101199 [Roseateles sp. YR242]